MSGRDRLPAGPAPATSVPPTSMHALLNPAELLASGLGGFGLPAALSVSGLAFATISLQAALDLYRLAMVPPGDALLIVLRGALLGTLGVALVGLLAHALTRGVGAPRSLSRTVSAVALAYGGALAYGLVGLALNLTMGWATAVSSGLTGLLWSLGPLFVVLREVSGGRVGLAATLATLGGSALLFGWVLVGVGR